MGTDRVQAVEEAFNKLLVEINAIYTPDENEFVELIRAKVAEFRV